MNPDLYQRLPYYGGGPQPQMPYAYAPPNTGYQTQPYAAQQRPQPNFWPFQRPQQQQPQQPPQQPQKQNAPAGLSALGMRMLYPRAQGQPQGAMPYGMSPSFLNMQWPWQQQQGYQGPDMSWLWNRGGNT